MCSCLACSSRRGNYFACRVVALRTKFLNSTTRRFFYKRKPIEKQRGDRNLRETEEIRGCHCVSMNYGVLPLSFSRASNSFRTIFFVGRPDFLSNRFRSLIVTSSTAVVSNLGEIREIHTHTRTHARDLEVTGGEASTAPRACFSSTFF